MAKTHYHVYTASDNYGRKGAPTALYRRGYAYASRTAANQFAKHIEPDPELRLVRGCTNPHCRLAKDHRRSCH